MNHAFGAVFDGRTVLVTGHTGFKGSWLSLWLQALGAHVVGYSLPAPTEPSNFDLSQIRDGMVDVLGDVRDYSWLYETIEAYQPEIIFHLAAQPLVLHSYTDPKETFDVNAGGTVNILEAARQCASVKAVVIVTTDKCYQNKNWLWGYRENDRLGGTDPYSASKSMAELAVASYNASFFKNPGSPAVASVRAGNVIGGGDFSKYRIVPDCMKALMAHEPVMVRNPASVRPWLNVLDPLSGYLWLGAQLLNEGLAFAEAWNFGPCEQEAISVQMLVEKSIELWNEGDWIDASDSLNEAPAEMNLLRINWDKAANRLSWRPVYDWQAALQQTVAWFKAYQKGSQMRDISLKDIEEYTIQAQNAGIKWSGTCSNRVRAANVQAACRHRL